LKLLFVIDKPQTLQIVDSLIRRSVLNNEVYVHSFFDTELFVPHVVYNKKFANLQQMIDFSAINSKHFDVIFAINHFNPSWKKLHSLDNCVGLEYCWNEIYNIHRQKQAMPGILYTNTEDTKKYLASVLPEQQFKSLGSPWFETVCSHASKEKKKQITVLAPHNNFLAADRESIASVEKFIIRLKDYAANTGRDLVLKDRRKFNNALQQKINFDRVVFDDKPFSHIKLYSESEAVIHFCSSAVCELAFCETPSLNLFGDIHRKLHQGDFFKPAISYVNKKHFGNNQGDGIHAANMESSDLLNLNAAIDKLENLVFLEKNWKNYQESFFPGDHANASDNIVEDVMKKYA
jgi:hypothetical protein